MASGATFVYRIVSQADLRAFQAVEQSLIRQRAQAVAGGKDISELQAKLARTQAAMATAPKNLQGGGGAGQAFKEGLLSKVPGGSALAGLSGGAAAGVAVGFTAAAAAVALAAKALADFAEKQVAVSELDTVLANQGQLTDAYREKLQGLAGAMESATNIADDQWLKALSKLTQAGADATNIEKLTEATKNFSAITGGDAESSAQALGRAMKGNFRAFQMLGIQVDKNASQTEKMDSLMRQLAERGGGILENRLKTLSGQTATFKTNVGNLSEGLGVWAHKFFAVEDSMNLLNSTLKFYADLMPQTIAKTGEMANALPKVTLTLEELQDATEKAKEETSKFTEANKESTAELDRQIGVLDKIRSRLDAQTDAATALKLAEIDAKEAGGKITGPEASKQRADVRGIAEQEKIRRELATLGEKQIVLSKAQAEEDKGIAETLAEVEALQKSITDEMARQQTIANLITNETGLAGKNDQGKLQNLRNQSKEAGRIQALAEAALQGKQDLLGDKTKAGKLAKDKRDQELLDIQSGIGIAGVKAQTSTIERNVEVVKARASMTPGDNTAQVDQVKKAALARQTEMNAKKGAFDPVVSFEAAAIDVIRGSDLMDGAAKRLLDTVRKSRAADAAALDKIEEEFRNGKTRSGAPSARP